MSKIVTLAIVLFSLILVTLTGCGGSGSATTQTPQVQKGLTVDLQFNGKKTTGKTVYGSMATAPETTIRDRSDELVALVAFINVQIETEGGSYIKTETLTVSNGVITSGNIQLNVGRYKLWASAYTVGRFYLYTSQAVAVVQADGSGQTTLVFEPNTAEFANVRINHLPGSWTIATSGDTETPYYNTDISSTLASLYPVYNNFSFATVIRPGDPADPNTFNILNYKTAIYSRNPETGAFDPSITIFFRLQDNNQEVFYGEYNIDLIDAIKTIDRDGYLQFDYPKSGSLNISSSL